MFKYVDHSKADKARRKKLITIGCLPRQKAKVFLRNNRRAAVYGRYPDGMVELGIPAPVYNNDKLAEKLVEIYRKRVSVA